MSDQDRTLLILILILILIQYQAEKGWGKRKMSMRAWLVDSLPNSQKNIVRIIWQTVRRINNDILGVKGLKCYHGVFSLFTNHDLAWAST